MDYHSIRAELRRMKIKDLFDLAYRQKEKWCNVGASHCGFFIRYKSWGFCLSELLGQGCGVNLEETVEPGIGSARGEGSERQLLIFNLPPGLGETDRPDRHKTP